MQLLDKLRGHLGGVVSNDFYERIKRLGHTEIVTLTSKRSLYVVYNRLGDLINNCSVASAIVRELEDEKTNVVNSPLSIVHTPSQDLLFIPWPFVFSRRIFLGKISCCTTITSISNSNDDENQKYYIPAGVLTCRRLPAGFPNFVGSIAEVIVSQQDNEGNR